VFALDGKTVRGARTRVLADSGAVTAAAPHLARV
jgi:hypothetical protein